MKKASLNMHRNKYFFLIFIVGFVVSIINKISIGEIEAKDSLLVVPLIFLVIAYISFNRYGKIRFDQEFLYYLHQDEWSKIPLSDLYRIELAVKPRFSLVEYTRLNFVGIDGLDTKVEIYPDPKNFEELKILAHGKNPNLEILEKEIKY